MEFDILVYFLLLGKTPSLFFVAFLRRSWNILRKRLRFTHSHTHKREKTKPEKMCQLVEFFIYLFFTLKKGSKFYAKENMQEKKGKMFELRRKCVSSFAILFANFTHFSISCLPNNIHTQENKHQYDIFSQWNWPFL